MMINGIDLFCGGGGSSWGARQAGVTMVGAVDAWGVATENYQANFPTAKVVTQRLDDRSGPEIFGAIGNVDLVIASPECTHHSIARGARPRCEESRRSAWYIMRFIRELKPRWVVLENVTMMKSWDGFEALRFELEKDYSLTIQSLDAADFSVPQTRRRLFIMGDRKGTPPRIVPPGTLRRSAATILDPWGTWKAGPAFTDKRAMGTAERIRRGISEVGAGSDFLVVYYSSDRMGGWQPLDKPLRTLTTLDRFGLVQWNDGVPTLRMLQVPELKRAMGFERCRFTGAEYTLASGVRRDHVRILGNGVCPPVMEAVISTLTGTRRSGLPVAA